MEGWRNCAGDRGGQGEAEQLIGSAILGVDGS